MTLYYSATSSGFFDSDIHAEIPEDAVEITAEEWQALLDGQSSGQIISTGAGGIPVLADPPPLSTEQLAAIERNWRDAELAKTDFTQLPDSPLSGANKTIYAAYRQQLRDWPDHVDFPESDSRPAAPF
jgi:hypothetical protein